MKFSSVFSTIAVMGLISMHIFSAFLILKDLSPGDPDAHLRATTDEVFNSVQLLKNGQPVQCKPKRLDGGKKWEFLCDAGNDCCCHPHEVCVYQVVDKFPNSNEFSNNVTVHIESHIADPGSEPSPPTKRETYSHTLPAAQPQTTFTLREIKPSSGTQRTLGYYIAAPAASIAVFGFFALVVVIMKDRHAIRTRKQSKEETSPFVPDKSQNSPA